MQVNSSDVMAQTLRADHHANGAVQPSARKRHPAGGSTAALLYAFQEGELLNMTGSYEEYMSLFKALSDDAIAADEERTQSDNQFKRRTYVRTVFALIEGDTFRRKHAALMLHDLYQEMLGVSAPPEQLAKVTQVVFTDAEIALIREEQYELDNKGEVQTRQKFLRPAANLRLSFKVYAKATDSSYELDVGGIGWDSYLKALAVRNRITHPRYERDIEISDEDLDVIQKAFQWYRDCTMELWSSAGRGQSGTQ